MHIFVGYLSSDKWCCHSDRSIEGIPFAKKIVDDILVWATDLPTLCDRVRVIAARCAKLNIALSKKKFAVGKELSFAELIFSVEGIKLDPERIVSLTRFPVPRDVTGVRSFLGLANQLSDFAHVTVHLRELTAKKNASLWLDDHQRKFVKVKQLLTSDMVVTHFNPDMLVTVLTDASRLHRLGYALGHYVDGRFKLVSCGSKSLTPTQQRYATIELKCLVVYFAIDKCSYYLKGVLISPLPLIISLWKALSLRTFMTFRILGFSVGIGRIQFYGEMGAREEPSYRRSSVPSPFVQPGRNRRHACGLC